MNTISTITTRKKHPEEGERVNTPRLQLVSQFSVLPSVNGIPYPPVPPTSQRRKRSYSLLYSYPNDRTVDFPRSLSLAFYEVHQGCKRPVCPIPGG